MSDNIRYETSEISEYFSLNRIKWKDLYESEKNIFIHLNPRENSEILDIGCGCGGLGIALKEKFNINSYTGIEINKKASLKAKKMNTKAKIHNGDFLEIDFKKKYDLVVSLSCIDWNVEFEAMLEKAWKLTKENGTFVISLRLTEFEGINDINHSFQFINYEGKLSGEKAPYVVLNYEYWLSKIRNMKNLNKVYGYGYYGKPSQTAVTSYKEVCFAVFSLTKLKKTDSTQSEIEFNLNLPIFFQNM